MEFNNKQLLDNPPEGMEWILDTRGPFGRILKQPPVLHIDGKIYYLQPKQNRVNWNNIADNVTVKCRLPDGRVAFFHQNWEPLTATDKRISTTHPVLAYECPFDEESCQYEFGSTQFPHNNGLGKELFVWRFTGLRKGYEW